MDASFDVVRRLVPETSTSFMVAPTITTGLPLDGLVATGAFSTRKLSSAYSGACMKVSRVTSTTQDIGFTGNSLDTTSLLSFAAGGDLAVVTWYDQSGNARDVTSGGFTVSPLIVSAGSLITNINGQPSLYNSGAQTTLTSGIALSNFYSASAFTTLCLARPTAAVSHNFNTGGFCGDTGGWTWFGPEDAGSTWGSIALGAGTWDSVSRECFVNFSGSLPVTLVGMQRFNAATPIGQVYNNGGTPGTVVPGGNIGNMTGTFALNRCGNAANFYTGYMAELITFNDYESAANCNSLGASMATYGGVTWTNVT